ncbi:MAG: hypothetical protein ACR2P5_05395 [Gammaproteobacteria bacterium]
MGCIPAASRRLLAVAGLAGGGDLSAFSLFLRKQESRVVNFCRKAKPGEGENLNAANDTGFLLSQE